ncbi:MAG: CCDC90 family protein [Nitrospirae bacterium]|nr:CCDC90 family protein [Nitrospirota bacterium]
MTFDTLAVATELKEAGFPPEQAEALARAWSHVASGELATKSDLVGVKSDLERQIAGVKSDLEKQIAVVRTEMMQIKSELEKKIDAVHSDNVLLKWMIGFSLGLSLLILGKLFAIHP